MTWHTLGGVFAILLWSLTVALVRSLSEQLGPITAAVAVYLIAGVFSLGRVFSQGEPFQALRLQSRSYLVGCGGLFVLYMFALFLAVGLSADRLQVLEIGLVNYLWPSLMILFSGVILQKRFRWLLIPATFLALAGIFLVMTQGTSISWGSFVTNVGSNPAAYGWALVAAVSWGLYSNFARRWARPGREGAVPWFMAATGGVLLVLRFLFPEQSAWSLQVLLEVVALSFATGIAYILWDLSMRRGDITLVASCSYFTPLLSTLVSCLYLGVVPGFRLWLGCILIVLGSILSWSSISDREPAFSS